MYTEGNNPRKSKNNHSYKNRRFDDDEQVINTTFFEKMPILRTNLFSFFNRKASRRIRSQKQKRQGRVMIRDLIYRDFEKLRYLRHFAPIKDSKRDDQQTLCNMTGIAESEE